MVSVLRSLIAGQADSSELYFDIVARIFPAC
jgi:hypothetical protein